MPSRVGEVVGVEAGEEAGKLGLVGGAVVGELVDVVDGKGG